MIEEDIKTLETELQGGDISVEMKLGSVAGDTTRRRSVEFRQRKDTLCKSNKQRNKKNHSHIKHSNYFVDVSYDNSPNPHNTQVIKPQSFPMRSGINFIKHNK